MAYKRTPAGGAGAAARTVPRYRRGGGFRARRVRRSPPDGVDARRCFPSYEGVAELDFAPVRPGILATCIVEAAGARGGLRARAGRPGRPLSRRRSTGRSTGREDREDERAGAR